MVPEVKNLPATQETQEMWAPSLGWEDPLEEEMAPHCSILAWEIPRTEEPGGLVHGVAKSRTRPSTQAGPHGQQDEACAHPRLQSTPVPAPGCPPPSSPLHTPDAAAEAALKRRPLPHRFYLQLSSTPPQQSLRYQSNLHSQRQLHTRQLPPGGSGLHGSHNAR